ncbi:RTA1 like protein-domain-containing protein [Mycena sanguinolenta]|nr:RTA1 like protein-domain-containing protein [Mycena sanguinolenta]
MPRLFNSLIFAACFAAVFANAATSDRDPNTDPIGGFVPKKSLSLIAFIFYAASGVTHLFHFFTVPPRSPFMIALPIGMIGMAIGFVLRILYANPPYTLGKYIIMDLCILLSPCLYLATDYMLLSRLARSFDEEVSHRCLLIRDSRITKIFVWSDVGTFLLQSGGGSLSASNTPSTAKLGNKIALIGLILQAVSFGLFTLALIVFGQRVSKHYPELWRSKVPHPFKVLSREPIHDWRILFYVMCATCVGILVRSIFRVAEYAGGYNGTISTHEAYFYLFDTVPLWISMTLYCVVWPVRALHKRSDQQLELGSRQNLSQPKTGYQ